MNKPITISLIAPIYGVERYIAEFAESVLSQSYPHIEYIFVNDGTKDSSVDILQEIIDTKYAHRKPQIKIINKENGGLPAARRTGLEHVTGDYVWHVDSDDWISAGSVEKIVAKIEQTGAEVVYFNYIKEYENRQSIKREREYTAATKQQYVRNIYNHNAFGTLCNKCIKHSVYTSHDYHTPKYGYAEDACMSVQLIGYANSVAFLNEDIYHYRKDIPTAMTSQKRRKRKREYALNFLGLYEKFRDVAPEKNPVAVIFDDLLIQAGWYSHFYRLGLFKEYPYLAKGVRRSKMHLGTDVPLPAQLYIKLIALFKK